MVGGGGKATGDITVPVPGNERPRLLRFYAGLDIGRACAAAECGVRSSDDGCRYCVLLSLCCAGSSESAGNIWLTAAIQWAANSPFRERTTTTIGIGPINCLAGSRIECMRVDGVHEYIPRCSRSKRKRVGGGGDETTAATAKKNHSFGGARKMSGREMRDSEISNRLSCFCFQGTTGEQSERM